MQRTLAIAHLYDNFNDIDKMYIYWIIIFNSCNIKIYLVLLANARLYDN